MPNVTISTVEEFQGTRFGPRIVELTTLLNLPLPTIMVLPLTKFERKDLWGFKVNQPDAKLSLPRRLSSSSSCTMTRREALR